MTRRVGDNKIALNCLKSSSMSNEWHGGDGGFHIDLGLGTHFIPQLSSVEIQLDSSSEQASKQVAQRERESAHSFFAAFFFYPLLRSSLT